MQASKLPRSARGAGTAVPAQFPWFRFVACGALLFGLGFASGRRDTKASSALLPDEGAQAQAELTGQKTVAAARPRAIVRPFIVRPVESCRGQDPEEERSYRAQQAADLVELLRAQTRNAEKTQGFAGPEAVANGLGAYAAAWAEAVVRTAPDLAEELASEMERTLCAEGTSEAQSMVVSRVMQKMPELGNERAFECIAARGKEDAVLWDALDAWRLGTLPMSPGLEKLASNSKDPRTLRRLIKAEDEVVEPPSYTPEAQQINTPVEVSPLNERDVSLALQNAQRSGDQARQAELSETFAALRKQAAGAPGADPQGERSEGSETAKP